MRNVLGVSSSAGDVLLEVRCEMTELALEGSSGEQQVDPFGQTGRLMKRGLRHLGDPASFPLRFHGDLYLPVLEPVGHVPLHRTIVELDDLDVDIELDAPPARSVEVLMKPNRDPTSTESPPTSDGAGMWAETSIGRTWWLAVSDTSFTPCFAL